MKKLLSAIVLLISLTSLGQAKNIDIQGWGNFKLGMSMNDSLIKKLKINNIEKENDGKVIVLTVNNYKLTNEIILKDFTLKFFDNNLYYMTCDYNADFKDALEIKYGCNYTKKNYPNDGFSFRFGNNGLGSLYSYYNSSYEKRYISWLGLIDLKVAEKIDKLNQLKTDERKNKLTEGL